MLSPLRLGIDFGTTRTVIAAVDRGNLPVLDIEDEDGDLHDHLPSIVAIDEHGELVAGWAAERAANAGQPALRAVKRLLADPAVTGEEQIELGEQRYRLRELLEALAREALDAVRTRSPLAHELGADSPIEAVLGVPAHAPTGQRLLTLDAFRRAGAQVLALVGEPSAAAFEFLHRRPRALTGARQRVVVYDLGGGTFDVSLVDLADGRVEVAGTAGRSRLGGEDFDFALAELALEAAGRTMDSTGRRERRAWVDAARSAKERIAPQSRRIHIDVGDETITVDADAYYERVAPLVEESIQAMAPLVGELDATGLAEAEIAGIYLVGGASALPLVPRMLRERFGRRVHRSPQPGTSTAIGLAIAADPDRPSVLRERVGRGIAVFRERDAGARVAIDVLVPPGARLDAQGRARIERSYDAAHTIGVYRFVELTDLDADGTSHGDLVPLAQVEVPLSRELADGRPLEGVPVERVAGGPRVEETLELDEHGVPRIRIRVPELGVDVERRIDLARIEGDGAAPQPA